MRDSSALRPGFGFVLRVLGFIAAMIAAAILSMRLGLGWAGALAVMLVTVAGIVPLVRYTERQAAASGNLSPALRRYNRRMMASAFVYTIALFVAVLAYKEWRPAGIAAWLIGFLPSVGVIAMVWSMTRLLHEEQDEYVRFRLVQSALAGGGVLLVVATIWGFFEQFALVPHVPSWAAVPVFAIGLGFFTFWRWLRA